MFFRCLIVPSIAAVAFHASLVFVQDTPPLPSQTERDACAKEFAPLRKEAEERGKLIKVATERHAPPEKTCKLIGDQDDQIHRR